MKQVPSRLKQPKNPDPPNNIDLDFWIDLEGEKHHMIEFQIWDNSGGAKCHHLTADKIEQVLSETKP